MKGNNVIPVKPFGIRYLLAIMIMGQRYYLNNTILDFDDY